MEINFSQNLHGQYLAAALLQEFFFLTNKPSCTVFAIHLQFLKRHPCPKSDEFSFGKTTPTNPRILTSKVRSQLRGAL